MQNQNSSNSINVQFIAKSSNSKTGAIPVTNSDRNTCPTNCKLRETTCYAHCGYYTRLNWDKVTNGSRGGNWSELCDKIAKLKPGQVWRHNVSGDLPHIDQVIDHDKLVDLIEANAQGKKRGFTYTHHNPAIGTNAESIKTANNHGFTINLSADNPSEADKLASLDIGPVVSIVPETQTSNFKTPAGNTVIICPAAIKDNVTCKDCKMCAIADRKTIIGFPAHGTGKSKIQFEA